MTKERIEQLRQQQKHLRAFMDNADPPKVLFLCDNESVQIEGNESGLVRFAIEILEASSGGQVSPDGWLESPWLPLEAIRLDPHPHFEEKKATLWQQVLFCIFFAVAIGIWVIGCIAAINWVTSRIHF